MELLRKKYDKELGTCRQRGEGLRFYDFADYDFKRKRDGKHGWVEVAACFLRLLPLVFVKALYWRSEENARNQLNCTCQLAYKVYIQTEVHIPLNISVSPQVEPCIVRHRDCLYKWNTWFGCWSVIWPRQDVIVTCDH